MTKESSSISRRRLLAQGGAALGVLALFDSALFGQVWGRSAGERVVPFLDPTPDPPQPALGELNSFSWDELSQWLTPNDDFFVVAHYDQPQIDAAAYRLEIGGLVREPASLSLDELRSLPRQEVTFTLECAGNNGFPWFVAGLGNARWAGTPLKPVLEKAGVLEEGIEVVFFGRDAGEEEFARQTVPQNFARSLSLEDALDPNLMLCYEMNGQPLPPAHGFPVRLIAPGWYGIANVKWLDRIEVWSRRYAGRFMARDYVTVREEPRGGGESVFTQKVVGRSLVKSVAAKVTEQDGRYRIYGAAWGAPIERVEVSLNSGPWQRATIDEGLEEEFAWKFWHYDWAHPSSGEHSLASRAIDRRGNVQPTSADPVIAKKLTYWESTGQITRRIQVS